MQFLGPIRTSAGASWQYVLSTWPIGQRGRALYTWWESSPRQCQSTMVERENEEHLRKEDTFTL